jgi:hypothetical protein
MIRLDVTYSVNGLLAPMTDTVEVPDQYTIDDITAVLNKHVAQAGEVLQRPLSVRQVLFARPHLKSYLR